MNPLAFWLFVVHIGAAIGVLAVMEADYRVYWTTQGYFPEERHANIIDKSW